MYSSRSVSTCISALTTETASSYSFKSSSTNLFSVSFKIEFHKIIFIQQNFAFKVGIRNAFFKNIKQKPIVFCMIIILNLRCAQCVWRRLSVLNYTDQSCLFRTIAIQISRLVLIFHNMEMIQTWRSSPSPFLCKMTRLVFNGFVGAWDSSDGG